MSAVATLLLVVGPMVALLYALLFCEGDRQNGKDGRSPWRKFWDGPRK